MNSNQIIVKTFEDVLKETDTLSAKKPSLLLGNGFSIAFDKSIFSYKSLYEQAQELGLFEKISRSIPSLFESISTFDFEHIMQVLKHFVIAGSSYDVEKELLTKAKQDEDDLKQILVEAITRNHPDDPASISEYQYSSCFKFLSNFKTIYSLNYDLLLYWVIVHFLDKLKLKDGFYDGNTGAEVYYQDDYVIWPTAQSSSADIYFLHGALHLFDAGNEIRKFCWSRTGVKIKKQILDALDHGMFPLFVSEGDAHSKLKKILHNGYLLKGLRSLAQVNGALVSYGLSFKHNDQHIIDAITDSTISHLYISIFGDPQSKSNIEMINNLSGMADRRKLLIDNKKRKIPLAIHYYDATSAKIWGRDATHIFQ
ncbi:MAG: DUF4917 family protein [Gammaproteobacteria bacterium]